MAETVLCSAVAAAMRASREAAAGPPSRSEVTTATKRTVAWPGEDSDSVTEGGTASTTIATAGRVPSSFAEETRPPARTVRLSVWSIASQVMSVVTKVPAQPLPGRPASGEPEKDNRVASSTTTLLPPPPPPSSEWLSWWWWWWWTSSSRSASSLPLPCF